MLNSLPVPLLVAISLIAGSAVSVLRGYYMKHLSDRTDSVCFFNIVLSLLCAVFIFIFALFKVKCSLYTLLLSLLFSAITACQGIASSKAVGIGPVSYTSVITSFSTIITAFSGLLIWGEKVSVWKYFGIVFMAASMVLSIKRNRDGDEKKKSVKWFVLTVIAMLLTAGVGLTQKTHQKSAFAGEIYAFLIITFILTAIIDGVVLLVFSKNSPDVRKQSLKELLSSGNIRKSVLYTVIIMCALCTALINVINLFLSGVLDSAVMFPVINGGTLILTIVSSVIILREKLTVMQITGIVMGLIAMVFLCI